MASRVQRSTKRVSAVWCAAPGTVTNTVFGTDPAQRYTVSRFALTLHRIRDTCGEYPLYKLHRDAAQRAEVAVQRVALLGEHHAGERAREHDMAGLHRRTQRAELVGEPGNAHRRMAQH